MRGAAVQFNKYLPINFTFWSRCADPLELPHLVTHVSTTLLPDGAEKERRGHRTILFVRIPRVFVHAFVLRLLTACRALRKSATSCARLHFINSDFLRFPLHTTCVRQTQHHETNEIIFLFNAEFENAVFERTQSIILQIFICDEMLLAEHVYRISLDKTYYFSIV